MHRSGTGLKARRPAFQLAHRSWRESGKKATLPEERSPSAAGRGKRHTKRSKTT